MKIPETIIGENKVRDADICMLYSDGYTPREIVEIRKLRVDVRRVQQICSANFMFVLGQKEARRAKRMNMLTRELKKKIDKGEDSKKDIVDIIEQLRKEEETEKGINITNQTVIKTVYLNEKALKEADGNNRLNTELSTEQV